jgi:hypothetical protein
MHVCANVCMQGTSSVFTGEDILGHITGAPDGSCMSMGGNNFRVPESLGNIPHAWATFPMIPCHNVADTSNINSGLFSLKCAAVGASMRGMHGRNKTLSDARVQLAPQQCVVLDGSCENFQFRHVTFIGAW